MGDVEITVDGAEVTLGQTAGGDVAIDGAAGALSVSTGVGTNAVDIVSRGHTTSVTVNGVQDNITIDGNGRGGYSESVESVTATSYFNSLTVSSDALETLNLAVGSGEATVNYETLEDLTVRVTQFGGRHVWAGLTRAATREGTLTLTADDADENVVESLDIEVVTASKFALHSDVKTLSVSGAAALNLQLDGNVDVAGKWVLENGEGTDDDEEVSQQYVLLSTTVDANNPVSATNPKYWTTIGGTVDGDELTADTADVLTAVGMPDGSEDAQDNWVTDSLESITVSGEAGLTVNASGSGDLTTVDASASTGKNSITLNATNKLTSVTGGSGNDTVSIKTGNLAATGLDVDLGAGDDTYVTGAGKNLSPVAADSSIDGGEGDDTLAMAVGADSTGHTYREAGKTKSIYTGFETLDVGGGSGDYDFGLLGVENIQVSKGTSGVVTLENVAAGTAINASGNSSSSSMTEAMINYQLAEQEGGSFDFGSTGIVDVNLRAAGKFSDKGDDASTRGVYDPTINGGSAVVMVLTVDDDQDIQGMMIDSSASAGGTALSSDYRNIICADATDVINVRITGNAKLTFKSVAENPDDVATRTQTALDALEYVDARTNTAGVVVYALDGAGRVVNGVNTVTLLGSEAADTFWGSQKAGVTNVMQGNGGNDTLYGGDSVDIFVGGAGADKMNGADVGNGGNDQFRYYAASDSQATFFGETAVGFDRIMNFTAGDSIRLSSDLLANSNNEVKSDAQASAGAGFVINSTDADADPAECHRQQPETVDWRWRRLLRNAR